MGGLYEQPQLADTAYHKQPIVDNQANRRQLRLRSHKKHRNNNPKNRIKTSYFKGKLTVIDYYIALSIYPNETLSTINASYLKMNPRFLRAANRENTKNNWHMLITGAQYSLLTLLSPQ